MYANIITTRDSNAGTERIKMNEAIRRYEESEEQIALASEKLKVETMARESCLRKKEECENELSQLQMTCATTKEKNSRCHDTLVHLQEECSKCDDTVSLKKTLMEIKQEKENALMELIWSMFIKLQITYRGN